MFSCDEAHQVVPAADARLPEAAEARRYLEKWKIDINDAANGVWLPHKARVDSSAFHRVIHAGEYYKKVVWMLEKAKSKEHAIRILKEIGRQLSGNTF
jgi:hypothetical protein